MPRKQKQRKYLMISAVAERFEIHPQTLRLYEREGLIAPQRSQGNTRLYDEETLQRLETILTLTRDLGVNLAGGRSHPQHARADGEHADRGRSSVGLRQAGNPGSSNRCGPSVRTGQGGQRILDAVDSRRTGSHGSRTPATSRLPVIHQAQIPPSLRDFSRPARVLRFVDAIGG